MCDKHLLSDMEEILKLIFSFLWVTDCKTDSTQVVLIIDEWLMNNWWMNNCREGAVVT